MTLRELSSLVEEVFGGEDLRGKDPRRFSCEQGCRTYYRVKWDIIFAHKLLQLYFWPSFFPPTLITFAQPICCDWDIPKGSLEPDIEYFLFEAFEGNFDSPLQIASDAPIPDFLIEPPFGDSFCIVCPIRPLLAEPFFESVHLFSQFKVKVGSGPWGRFMFADAAL